MSGGSAVGIATEYGLDDRGVEVRLPVESRIFHFSISSRQALGYVIGKKRSRLKLVPSISTPVPLSSCH
jgi:hypothetical protein